MIKNKSHFIFGFFQKEKPSLKIRDEVSTHVIAAASTSIC